MEHFLTKKERKDLRGQHRLERERRYADRIKALLLWDKGWGFEEISEALLLDETTIRRYRQWYEEEGMERLLNDDCLKDTIEKQRKSTLFVTMLGTIEANWYKSTL